MIRLGAQTTAAPCLFAAVLSGVVYMALAGAPIPYPMINLAALGLALVLTHFTAGMSGSVSSFWLALGAAALLWMPLLTGPEIDGVRRWIGAGVIRLHAGPLLLPVLLVLLPRIDRLRAIGIVAVASLAIALQPDSASALALLGGTLALAGLGSGSFARFGWIMPAASLAATYSQQDVLQPVRFVEHVLTDAWMFAPAIACFLAAALAALLVLPTLSNRQMVPVSAMFASFTLASLFGHYPVPFIGYGAGSILGYGLAAGLIKREGKPA